MFSRNTAVSTLPPAAQVPEQGYEEPFPLVTIEAPVLTGTALRMMLAVAESPLAGPIRAKLLRQNRIPQILEEIFVPERASFQPNTVGWPAERGVGEGWLLELGGGEELAPAEVAAAAAALLPDFAAASSSGSAGQARRRSAATPRRYTAADFHRAYASGATSPAEVAERIIAAVAASEAQDPPMRFFVAFEPERIRQQAAASTARWAAGAQLSPLDGVPFAVKDCVDALPYPTTAGTAFMADWRTPVRSLAGVEALEDAGALLLGKTTLHEIGLGTTGLNLVTGTCRNPHSPAHHTGGSSSGSAAVVAAGLCPFAIGTDGGGSIRIPAACCGVVGLKPTHFRVGSEMAVPPIDQTVAVTGPIGGTVQDTALMYALIGNTGHPPGGHPAGGMPPPPVALPAALGGSSSSGAGESKPLAGLKAGIFWKWFELAAAPVVEACRAVVSLLEARGLEVVALEIPELALLRAAHSCTILSEMKNSMNAALQHGPARRSLNAETRASLAMAAGGLEGSQYVQAQKIRTRIDAHFRRAFKRCDVLLTPTLPCTAPPVRQAALACDLTTTSALMTYVLAPNFIGLPGLTVPVGTAPATHTDNWRGAGAAGARSSDQGSSSGASDAVQLPVGLHIMAPCWHEATLLHVGGVLEAAVAAAGSALPLPGVWFDMLQGEGGGKPASES